MTPPAWLIQAQQLLGTKEVAGAGDNPTILGWAQELGGWVASFYQHDEIPWCGLFVGICMKRVLLPLPANALGAKNWADWGQPLTEPCVGAVMVFQRPGGGHVAFYCGEDDTAYHVLGGNQSDSVDITRVAKDRCIAMRWPAEVMPYGEPVLLTSSGQPVSTNET